MLTTKELQITGKCPDGVYEDGAVVTPHFAAVIDGSTSKSKLPPLPHGLTRGQVAMQAVCQYIETADPEADVERFCQGATQAVRDLYHTYYPTDVIPHMQQHPEDRFCCSAIVYSQARHQVWMIGDCQALIGDLHATNDKPYEAVLAARRAEILVQMMAGGLTIADVQQHDPGRDAIIPQMLQAMRGQNVDYAVIDGFDIPMQHVTVHTVPPGTRQLVLASDGYLRLFPTLADTERYTMEYLQGDPLLVGTHQATKGCRKGNLSHDDRTYLRIEVE